MTNTTRRGFFAVAGAGAAVAGVAALDPASAKLSAAPAVAPAAAPAAHVAGPVVAHIADAATGMVSVMVGEREVVVHDPALVAKLAAIVA